MGALQDAIDAAERTSLEAKKWQQQSAHDQQRQMLQNEAAKRALIFGQSGLFNVQQQPPTTYPTLVPHTDPPERQIVTHREPPKKPWDRMRVLELLMAIASLITAAVALAFSQGWI